MNARFKKLSERNMELRSLMNAIVDKAKAEKRSNTQEEMQQYDQYRNEHNANMMELQDIKVTEEYRKAHGAERSGLMQLLRDARTKEGHMVELPACSEMLRTAISAGSEGSDVIEAEFKGLLEPLYAQSALAKLGVRFYPGLPQGNIHVPIMGKGTVGWATEMGNAGDGAQTFTSVELTPKRLTAYVDISKQLLNQDTRSPTSWKLPFSATRQVLHQSQRACSGTQAHHQQLSEHLPMVQTSLRFAASRQAWKQPTIPM